MKARPSGATSGVTSTARRSAKRPNWLPLWALALMVVMAIGTVWLRLQIVRTTYAIDQVDRRIHALQQAREQMDIKITALRSPRRLEQIARSKFGLVPPRSEQIVHMTDELTTSAASPERAHEAKP